MSAALNTDDLRGTRSFVPMDRSLRRLHGAGVVRIPFGFLGEIDAVFKWPPGFGHGQTLGHDPDESMSSVRVRHQWGQMWRGPAWTSRGAFAAAAALSKGNVSRGGRRRCSDDG